MDHEIRLPLRPATPHEQYWLTVRATGPETRVAKTDGPAPVVRHHLEVEPMDAADDIPTPRTAGCPQQSYALPAGLTEEQLAQLLTRLADSGMLETVFANQVEAGEHRAVVVDEDAATEVAEWIARTGIELAQGEEAPAPAPKWSTWLTVEGYSPYVVERWLRPAAQHGLPALLVTGCGALAWPQGRPEDAVTQHPERLLERLQALDLLPPIPRQHIAAAAWRAGYRNIRSLGQLLNADRKTLYTYLRAAGIEPTDRTP
ncbi:hypothetical protein [Streptomyces prasinus]